MKRITKTEPLRIITDGRITTTNLVKVNRPIGMSDYQKADRIEKKIKNKGFLNTIIFRHKDLKGGTKCHQGDKKLRIFRY
jgi:hypothetical protein